MTDDDKVNAPRDRQVGVESVAQMIVAAAALVPDRPYIGVIVAARRLPVGQGGLRSTRHPSDTTARCIQCNAKTVAAQ